MFANEAGRILTPVTFAQWSVEVRPRKPFSPHKIKMPDGFADDTDLSILNPANSPWLRSREGVPGKLRSEGSPYPGCVTPSKLLSRRLGDGSGRCRLRRWGRSTNRHVGAAAYASFGASAVARVQRAGAEVRVSADPSEPLGLDACNLTRRGKAPFTL